MPVGFAVCFGVLIAIARLAGDPTGRLLGHTFSEVPGHLWMQWLLERALFDGKAWFGQTDIVLGEAMWVVPTDWLNRAAAVPLGRVLGPVAAYNLIAAGLLAMSGLSAAFLARAAGARPWPCALAALLVVWSPPLLGFLADGRLDSVGLCWVGFLAAAWVAAMRAPSWRAGLAVGGWAVCVILAGPNLTMATVLAALIPSAVAVAARRQRLKPLASAAAIAAVAAVAVLALLLFVENNDSGRLEQHSNAEQRPLIEAVTPETIAQRRMADFWHGAYALNREVPVHSAWIVPPQLADNPATLNAASMGTVQPYAPGAWWGFSLVPWGLALFGLFRRPRAVLPWVGAAAGLHLLAMGHGSSQTWPFLLNGTYYYVAPAVLLERLPGLSVFNNYGLFATFATLALSTAAALAISGMPRRAWIAAGLAVIWMVEVQRGPVPLPLAVHDIRLPEPFLAALDGVPAERAIFFLPMSKDLNNYLQTQHSHPTLMRFRHGESGPNDDPILADPTGAANELLRAALGGPPARPRLPERLAQSQIGAVVVMPDLLPNTMGTALDARVRATLGEPSWSDGHRHIYRLGPAP